MRSRASSKPGSLRFVMAITSRFPGRSSSSRRVRCSLSTMAPDTSNRLWHPFAAMGKVDGHELVLVRGEGCQVWDASATSTSTHGRALVREHRSRAGRDRRCGRGAAADACGTSHLRRPGEPARARPGAAPRGAIAGTRCGGLLRQRRRRGGRYGREDRAPLLGSTRSAAPHRDRLAEPRLPRHERLRHLAVGHPRNSRRLRHADRGRRRGPYDDAEAVAQTLDRLGDRAAAFIGEPMIGAGGPSRRRRDTGPKSNASAATAACC